jgi:hypothetical protein
MVHLAEQAVSTSMVYLFRSMGSVWGVAAASTIIQNNLVSRLPGALSGIPEKLKVIPSPQQLHRHVYSSLLVSPLFSLHHHSRTHEQEKKLT